MTMAEQEEMRKLHAENEKLKTENKMLQKKVAALEKEHFNDLSVAANLRRQVDFLMGA